MSKISIEYAHIYTNDHISDEQDLSLDVLKRLKVELGLKNHLSLVVLVDDYSFPDPSFDYALFSNFLDQKGYMPDVLFRESALISNCDQTLGMVADSRLKQSMIDYIKAKKYPCSLFIASWYLLRLGYLSHDSFKKELYAERLINILPESFKPFEDQAFKIIESTQYSDCLVNIRNEYISGRLIA